MKREKRDPWGLDWWKLYSESRGGLPGEVGEKWIGGEGVEKRQVWEDTEKERSGAHQRSWKEGLLVYLEAPHRGQEEVVFTRKMQRMCTEVKREAKDFLCKPVRTQIS